jgi:hypothetical protein
VLRLGPSLGIAATLAVAYAAIAAGPGAGGASQSVTMASRQPAVPGPHPASLFGTVGSDQRGEIVTIEAKNCGLSSFTEVASARTEAGGRWTLQYWPGVNTTLRARWKSAVSPSILLGQQAWVSLVRLANKSKFTVSVTGKFPVWRKRVLIQRRLGGSWKPLRTVVLTEQIAVGSTGGVITRASFRMSLPRGTRLRAVLPRSEARPCYYAGVSDTVRA